MQSERANIGRLVAAWTSVLQGALPPMTFDGIKLPSELLAAPDGFLPLFLSEADVLWEKMARRPTGLLLERNSAAALQVHVQTPPSLPVSAVLLCMTYASEQLQRPGEPTISLDAKVAEFEGRLERYLPIEAGIDLTQVQVAPRRV